MSSYPTKFEPDDHTSAAPGRHPFATAPAWSLLGIVAGGLVSINLIPAGDYQLPGALLPPTLALSAGLFTGIAVAGIRSAIALFRAEHILSFGVFYWLLLDLLLGHAEVTRVSHDAVAQSFAAITLFALALWTGSVLVALGSRRPTFGVSRFVPDLTPRFLFVAAMVSGFLGIARVIVGCRLSPTCVVDAFYHARGVGVWLYVDTFGHFDTLFLYSRYFGFLVLPLTVALVSCEGRFTRRSIFTLVLGLICLAFMVGDGGRKDVGTVVGTSLLTWALMKQRVQLRHLVGVAVLAGALVLLMQVMLVARDIGIGSAIERKLDFSQQGTPVGVVDRNFRFFSNIVQLVPGKFPYEGWQGVAYAVTIWVPGGLVPSEWQTRNLNLPAELGMWVPTWYSWACSAVCDLYLISGFPAVVIGGLLFGALARLVSRLMMVPASSRRPVLYALLSMTLFMSLRALPELFVTGFVVLAFSGLVILRQIVFCSRPFTSGRGAS